MGSLPRTARLYLLLVSALAVGAVLFSVQTVGSDLGRWFPILGLALGIAVLDLVPIDLYGERVEVTLSNSIKVASILLYPVPIVVLGTFLGTVLGEFPAKRARIKKVFNVSEMTITWGAAALGYVLLHQSGLDYFDSLQNVFAVIFSGLIGFATNTTLVSLIISLSARLDFRYTWSQTFRQVIWHELSIIALGTFLAVLWRFNHLSVVLAGLPLFFVRHSYKTAKDLQGQTRNALLALVRVIDERDHHTSDHSDRVALYARLIAEAMGLSQEEIEIIVPAAQLHDLGKVGMADDILFNPRILNSHERSKAQKHAEVGAMLLSKFPLFDKGAVLVKHHHERYDGTGYPDGLKGEAIPIGSRIISVADAFQAMTEDRPYRRALSQDEAIAQLVAGSGTQFDPKVVQAFLSILESRESLTPSAPVVIPDNAQVA